MKAKIVDKKIIATNTLWVKFDLLGKEINFKPGQYFYLSLINPPYKDSRGNERHFSIVNSPNQKGVIEMATRILESAFKKSLNEILVGSEVEIGMIGGSFILPKSIKKPLVFISGGIGITPFMSMLKFINEEKLPYKVILIYSNRNKESTAFFEELNNLSKKNSNFKIIFTMTDDNEWQGEKRIIDSQFIKDYVSDLENGVFMTAGPPKMVEAIVKTLKDLGIKNKNIISENFTGY